MRLIYIHSKRGRFAPKKCINLINPHQPLSTPSTPSTSSTLINPKKDTLTTMQLSERQWKTLVKDIQQQRCILLLGNRAAISTHLTSQPERLTALLAQHLGRQMEEEEVAYEQDQSSNLAYMAQRFLSAPKTRRIDLEDEVTDFYTAATRQVPEFYQKLAALPFCLTVNLSPDDYLLRAWRAAGKAGAQTAYYNFRKEQNSDIEQPSPAKPLVYNLLGALKDPESLVLTQEDRVDFIKNVVKGNPGIPNAVMSHFDERKTYIFLGLNLENWDYRLLFDTLHLSRENLSFLPQPSTQTLSPEARSFFEDRYRLLFTASDIQAFVDNLAARYTEYAAETDPTPVVLKKVVVLFNRNEADSRFVQSLSDHLSSWVKRGALEIWHQDMPFAGDTDQETLRSLAAADAVLPVLSADFWADEKISGTWLPEALRQQQRGLRIIPLLHRACDVESTDLAPFTILPVGGKPVRNWSDEDDALKNMVDHLKKLLYD